MQPTWFIAGRRLLGVPLASICAAWEIRLFCIWLKQM